MEIRNNSNFWQSWKIGNCQMYLQQSFPKYLKNSIDTFGMYIKVPPNMTDCFVKNCFIHFMIWKNILKIVMIDATPWLMNLPWKRRTKYQTIFKKSVKCENTFEYFLNIKKLHIVSSTKYEYILHLCKYNTKLFFCFISGLSKRRYICILKVETHS